jgi:hypothetical protein
VETLNVCGMGILMICTASGLQCMQQFDTSYGRACPEMESRRCQLRRTQSGRLVSSGGCRGGFVQVSSDAPVTDAEPEVDASS